MEYTAIRFPHLGILFSHVGRSVSIGNFEIMYYGMIIACGFLAGLLVAQREAKRTGQDPELYLDFLLCLVVPAIVGARIYYVAFSWDYYGEHLSEIINLRHGGLGIVGGVAAGILTIVLFAGYRKQSALLMLDTVTMSMLIGQILGRWGNFFNREAFGGYTDGIFAMQIPVKYFEQYGRLSELRDSGLLDHLVNVTIKGQTLSCIQVHPTFLYEGLWNLFILMIIVVWRKRKQFNGELLCIYFVGYGTGRFMIESLRTDQLQIGHTGIAATQVVCICMVIGGLTGLIRGNILSRKRNL